MAKTEYMNPEELAVEADTSVIPSFAVNLTEQSLYVAEAAESEFNAMMESIGVEEISVYESTGKEVVYEGASFDSLKKTIIEFFKGLWAKIKGLFDGILKKYEAKKKERATNIATNVDLAKLDDSKYKPFKVHKYDGLKDNAVFLNIEQNCKNMAAKLKNYKNDGPGTLNIDVWKDILTGVVSTDAKSADTVVKAVKNDLMGEKVDADVAFVKTNWDKIKDTAINGNNFKGKIKAAYKAEKKVIDDIIKAVKDVKEEDANEFKTIVSHLKDIAIASKSVSMAVIDVAKRQESEYASIFVKVAAATKAYKNTKGGEDSTNESVDPAIKLGTTQKDLIEASFDW